MTNKLHTTLYIGVTNNLQRRIFEHKQKLVPGFSKRYNLTKLVYYEEFLSIYEAISREKQLKAGSRIAKLKLILNSNPQWLDLSDSF